jgi:pimeloyl-ACP methyl ester carboxylesterase
MIEENFKTNYEIIGKGKKTIVFVHYFGGDAGSWQWVTKRLKKKYTCILINLPGVKNTLPLEDPSIYEFAKYINFCIEELQLKYYTLCGHSMGGKLVLYAAKINQGNKPNKIILIAPSPPTFEKMSGEEKNRMLNHPNIQEAKNTIDGATIKKLSKKCYEYAVNSQLQTHQKTWNWWLEEGMDNNIAEQVNDLNIDTYVIYSRKDPIIKTATIFSEVLPNLLNTSVVGIGNVGHLIPLEAPRKLARQLRRILNYKIQSNDCKEIF